MLKIAKAKDGVAVNHTHRAVFDRRQMLSIHPSSTPSLSA